MSQWKEYKLGELFAESNQGVNTTTEKVKYSESGVKVIRAKNIFDYKIDFENVVFVSDETFKKLKQPVKPRIGDVLFTNIGSQLGSAALVKNAEPFAIAWNVFRISADTNELNAAFLMYLLNNPETKYFIKNLDSSSTMPFVSGGVLRTLEFTLPPLPEQTAIASVLNSLDDKIDLLHRQNATLEKLAETLFRQWFVEEAKEDWGEVELGSVIETTSGGTPSRAKMEYYEEGTIPWVKSKELNGSFILETEEMITDEALKKSSAKGLPKNSILIAMYGATVGEYAIITKEMTCNQAVCALKPNTDYPYSYLFLLIKRNKDELINMAVGSAQQNISQLLIKQLPVLNCVDEIKQFNFVVEPFFEKIKANQTQIRTLTTLRNTLLPKLMSGEVRIA